MKVVNYEQSYRNRRRKVELGGELQTNMTHKVGE